MIRRLLFLALTLLGGCAQLPPVPASNVRPAHPESTPLGQTAVRVYRNNINATLDDGDKHYQADNADALMEKVLGWHLPLRGLHQWALGLPDTDSPAQIKRDSKGRISELMKGLGAMSAEERSRVRRQTAGPITSGAL